jgi:predicted metal-binding membrane protein
VVMGIEKNVSWGKKLSAPLGILLVASGLLLLVKGLG